MLKIMLNGANGKMGRVTSSVASVRNDCTIIAGIDRTPASDLPFPIFNSICKINVSPDVIIDFSNPALIIPLLDFAIEKKCPVVICTTGFSEDQIAEIKKSSKKIPIFFSGNTSIGINLLIELAKKALAVLGNEFDIEIIEKHHNQKVDAPSGTALMIAKALEKQMKQKPTFTFDRHISRKQREKNEIGIHSIRAGSITGEHEIIFAGNSEAITINHCAQSKKIFATGAINAALFLKDKNPGLYFMEDLLK